MPKCECKCGNDAKPGNRFINGHHNHKFEPGEKNIRWRGDQAGHSAIHKWLNKVRPLTGVCEKCGATDVRTEMSNIDHSWRRVVEDYRELCSRCHRYYDYLELGTPNPRLDKATARAPVTFPTSTEENAP